MNVKAHAPARVLVVDDHPIVRLGVRQMISADPDLTICGEAETADAAITAAETTRADLAIVDLSLDSGTSLELIRKLHEKLPNLAILVLSMHDERLYGERTLRAGARGYIMKQEAIGGLVGAIHQVLSGKIYVSKALSQGLLERLSHHASEGDPLMNLTDREIEVFELIGRGLSTSGIADKLGVSVKTVETYRANIKGKLNLRDAHDLIRHATAWTGKL